MKDKKKVVVKVYFNPKTFSEIAELSERAGFRRGGLVLYTQKKHGFSNEKIANTDGISKFLKYLIAYWKASEGRRLSEMAEILKQEEELKERKNALRMPSGEA